MPSPLLALLGVAGLVWFWLDGLHAREIALGAATRSCEAQGLQLLDQSVSLARLRLRRDAGGRVRLARTYRFEFSTDGIIRQQGFVLLLGHAVESVGM